MKPLFREEETTDLATFFIRANGGSINKLKLMKLLYIADRETFIKYGTPITYDSYFSMKNGPVLSNTLNLMDISPSSNFDESSPFGDYWCKNIYRDQKDPNIYRATPESKNNTFENLCKADLNTAQEIHDRYQHLSGFQLAELTHEFAEWKDPGSSRYPIDFEDILKAGGRTEKEIENIMSQVRIDALFDQYSQA